VEADGPELLPVVLFVVVAVELAVRIVRVADHGLA
jgi:hypothetical protein